ncbi:motility associated factor glycosyltransferase family protein [Treponema pedis]|uniref:motility associated factor glycosyltransferase family protein n=1 Tax=Treponema pedis TaxID=409322 RepID=UPI002091AADB|nr:6-hydroxymethylpterin diphosphokinase MptE-like protein [Treponema pedis]
MKFLSADSHLKKNLFENAFLFSKRFPALADTMHLNSESSIENIIALIPENYSLQESKLTVQNKPVYTACIGGKFIHSKYNPLREAEQSLISDFFKNDKTETSCIFYGLGLGYLPEIYAAQRKNAELVIIEPDVFLFLLFLASRPLTSFFNHKKLILLIGAYPNEVVNFFENYSNSLTPIFMQSSVMEVNSSWFSELEILQKRNKQKNELNKNTLKKFGKLWAKNFFKNLPQLEKCINVSEFKNRFTDCSALIIAAGPGLNSILELIKKNEDKLLVIAADTAVRACLKAGITPDFILLMDGQYWNYLHLADIDISSSILVTELAVYPAVFRLKVRATVLASSVFPLAQHIEKEIGSMGKIITGGSVATACWDFARNLGVKEIICAGLDLSFPEFQTHFKGSRFEEDSNKNSFKLKTAEAASHFAVYSAKPELNEGYNGKILTDIRMKMYAWWFESKIAEFPEIKTFNLAPKGLKIPNMPAISEKEFSEKIKTYLCSLNLKQKRINKIIQSAIYFDVKGKLKNILRNLQNELLEVEHTVSCASSLYALCTNNLENKKHNNNSKNTDSYLKELNLLNEKLKNNKLNKVIGFDLLLNEDGQNEVYSYILESIKNLQKSLKAFF